MNKIKQNKITFTLILSAITIIFSSLTLLSLPVLFNYESKVTKIEKNFFKNFKIYLKSSGKISYKPFPKPHLLVENAGLNLSESTGKNNLIDTSNLKIFISLRNLYLRSFDNLSSTQISNSNINLEVSDIKKLRKHLYEKVNKPIKLINCKIFLKNKKNEVILISPIKTTFYKINNKNKIKSLIINGQLFGLNFKSEWKRNYNTPKISSHSINIFNPNIEIKNIFEFQNTNKFKGTSQIFYDQDKLVYNYRFNNNKININSPNIKNSNFNLNSEIQLNPFYFVGDILIKKKKLENIIDNMLINFLLYDESFLGNFNGKLKIKFDDLNNKLIRKGEIIFDISEKKISLKTANFNLNGVGNITTNLNFYEKGGQTKFITKNVLNINNHIEFAKIFQIGSKKIKNINKIYFDLEKNVGETDFIIRNVKIDNKINKIPNEIFLIKNIQNLRSHIRKVIN